MKIKLYKQKIEGEGIIQPCEFWTPADTDLDGQLAMKHLMGTVYVEPLDVEILNTLAKMHNWQVYYQY